MTLTYHSWENSKGLLIYYRGICSSLFIAVLFNSQKIESIKMSINK